MALKGAPGARRRRLQRAGALVLDVPGRGGRVGVGDLLRELGRRGITKVLVEGGSQVLGALLDARLADRLVLFVAGRVLGGGDALPVFGGKGVARLRDAARIKEMTVRPVGPDFQIEGTLVFPGGN